MGVDSWPTGKPASHRAGEVTHGGSEAGRATPQRRASPAPPRPTGRSSGRQGSPPAGPRPAPRTGTDADRASTTTRVDRSSIPPRHRADTRAIVVGGPLGDQRGLTAAGAVV